MCIIIVKQKKGNLPHDVARLSAQMNPDGMGIMWLDTFEVELHKSNKWRLLDTERPFIVHFRYATIGAVNKSNTHPFQCGKSPNEWLMMNGTIRELGDATTCDTKVLANQLGEKPRQSWKDELSKHLCRFVTINTKSKSFQIYNKGLWVVRDGVWYSKDYVLETNMVAVYGTLKKGNSNYWYYLDRANFLGKGTTKDKYPLVCSNLPMLVDKKGVGYKVEVDVFAVSDSKLAELDRLEGHPTNYQRKQIWIKGKKKGGEVKCWVYFHNNVTIDSTSILLKTYDESYKPIHSWAGYDYKQYEKKDKAPCVQRTFYFEDEMQFEEEDVKFKEQKPLCIECFSDLEFDRFANYHCNGCDSWFAEDEVLKFNNYIN